MLSFNVQTIAVYLLLTQTGRTHRRGLRRREQLSQALQAIKRAAAHSHAHH